MLIDHYTDPPTGTAQPDPMRAGLASSLAAVGNWPALTRRVAIANGSGTRADQGFAPLSQVVRWEYSSLFVAITGDIWALPDQASGRTRSSIEQARRSHLRRSSRTLRSPTPPNRASLVYP